MYYVSVRLVLLPGGSGGPAPSLGAVQRAQVLAAVSCVSRKGEDEPSIRSRRDVCIAVRAPAVRR